MFAFLRLLHVPFWRRSPLGVLLPALGVALGVATIVAIDLAGASAVESFRATLQSLEGRATHRVVGPVVPDDLARRLSRVPGVEAAAPVVEKVALFVPAARGSGEDDGRESLRLLGLDPLAERAIRSLGVNEILRDGRGSGRKTENGRRLREFLGRPGALLVSGPFLDRHGLREGDRLGLVVGALRREAFVLARLPTEVGGLEVPDNLAVGDVSTVQELTGRFEGVDRVDLVIAGARHGARRGGGRAGPNRAGALVRVEALLPPGLTIEEPGGRAARLEGSLAAFRANIRALSYLALFVSFFLIYNSVLLSVLRRRPLIAVARCLGATRAQVMGGWLLEALLTALAGVVVGIGLGLVFAGPALERVSRTAADLYGAAGGGRLSIPPATFLEAAGLGLLFTLLSALPPAFEAAATPPAHTAARSGVERAARGRHGWARLVALPLLGVMAAALAWRTPSPVPGYVAAGCLALAAALLVPSGLDVALRALLSRRFGLPGGIARAAAASIRANMSRTGVAVAALTVALSMSVAMGALVDSFRRDLVSWIEGRVRADVYVTPLGMDADPEGATLPEGLEARLAALPEVTAVDAHRERPALAQGRDAFLASVEVPVLRGRAEWPLLDGGSAREFFDALEAGGAAISEPLHRKTGLARGDRIGVVLEGRVDSLTVAGVYRDFGSDQGTVLVDHRAFSRVRDLGPPRSLALYLQEGLDVEEALPRLLRAAGADLALQVRTNRELKSRALAVFERTFSITRGMELVGLSVAAIGILSALLAMLLERSRELATLRALGATRGQLAGLFLGESTLLAASAWLFAAVTGGALSWILFEVINVRSFGWAIGYRMPWAALGTALAASLLAAWAATLWPLWRLSRIPVADLLREE
jgi:putative ABC transport system permease protein